MKNKVFPRQLVVSLYLLIRCGFPITAQRIVEITPQTKQHIFSFDDIYVLEDSTNALTFNNINKPALANQFRASKLSTPQTQHLNSTYWFKIKINTPNTDNHQFLLEFFDQTIDQFNVYLSDSQGKYQCIQGGDTYPFIMRYFKHKNFEIPLPKHVTNPSTIYIQLKSSQKSDVILVVRSLEWFVAYSLNEYFTFGIFYGMILVFGFYNLLLFLAIRQRQYVYYVLYILAIGLYEMCTDGIAYQLLWPNSVTWNQYAYGVSLYLITLFALLFTQALLHTRVNASGFHKLINSVIIARSVLFVYTFFFNQALFIYKQVEIIPFLICFATGIYCWIKGYKPARFFVLGYTLLFVGLSIKFLIVLTDGRFNIGVWSYYSLSICFILEMMAFSFAAGDRVRVLKFKKEEFQRRIIKHIQENSRLKDRINQQLEDEIRARTQEIIVQSEIIQKQNDELLSMNMLLKEQADEISVLNIFLQENNLALQVENNTIRRARIMASNVDFQEFSRIYPDKQHCYDFLTNLKWKNGFICQKCDYTQFFQGHLPYSRRCKKCSYEESVTMNTFFENSKIEITKAFYLVFLCYSTNCKITSYRLSELLSIRQSTCWAYQNRVKKIMQERKKEFNVAGEEGWSKLLLK
jgi:predicted small metal-binding protein